MKNIIKKISLFVVLGVLIVNFSSMSYKYYSPLNDENNIVIHGNVNRPIGK